MKCSIYFFVFLVMICLSCHEDSGIYDPNIEFIQPQISVSSKWQQTNGPYGGPIKSLVSSTNGYLFAGSNGLYVSKDNGENWKLSNLTDLQINILSVNSNGDIYTAYNGYIYISSDNGETWLKKVIRSYFSVSNLYIRKNEEIYVSTCGRGILHSTNNGESWREESVPINGYDCIRSVTITSKGQIFITSYPTGIITSKDNCQTWIQLDTVFKNNFISFICINEHDDIYACSDGSGIYRSTNDGISWQRNIEGMTNLYVHTLFIKSTGEIFAGTLDGVYFSTNNGDHWRYIGLKGSSVNNIIQGKNNYIFCVTENMGIVRSVDNGYSWAQSNVGIICTYISLLAINSKNRLFAVSNGSDLFYSDDEGDTWEKSGSINYNCSSFVINSKDQIFTLSSGKVYKSIDNGISWVNINNGLTSSYKTNLTINTEGKLFVGDNNGVIYLSSNNGDTWNKIYHLQESIKSIFINSYGYIFVNTARYFGIDSEIESLYYSTNEGVEWNKINLQSEYTNISFITGNSRGYVFASSGQNLLRMRFFRGLIKCEILKFTESGISFLTTNKNDEIITGTNRGEVYTSLDNGDSWTLINSGLTGVHFNSMVIGSKGNIFAGTGGKGVFRGVK